MSFPSVNHLLMASEPIARDENRWEEIADCTTVALDADFNLSTIDPPLGWVSPDPPTDEELAAVQVG